LSDLSSAATSRSTGYAQHRALCQRFLAVCSLIFGCIDEYANQSLERDFSPSCPVLSISHYCHITRSSADLLFYLYHQFFSFLSSPLQVVPDDDDVQNFLGEGNLRSSYYVAQENLLTIPTGMNRLYTMLKGTELCTTL
jgi:hypothetical protein